MRRRAARSSRTPSSHSGGAGTSWPGTSARRLAHLPHRPDGHAGLAAGVADFAPREVPGGDAAAYVAANRHAGVNRHTARITVHAPAEEVQRRVRGGGGTVTPLDDRRCELVTGDDDLHWLGLRVLMLGAEVEVHEPPELREHLARPRARAADIDATRPWAEPETEPRSAVSGP